MATTTVEDRLREAVEAREREAILAGITTSLYRVLDNVVTQLRQTGIPLEHIQEEVMNSYNEEDQDPEFIT